MNPLPEELRRDPASEGNVPGGRVEADLRQQWRTFDTVLSHTADFNYTFDLNGHTQPFYPRRENLAGAGQKPVACKGLA